MPALRHHRWLALGLLALFFAQSSAWASHGHGPGEDVGELTHTCFVCESVSDRSVHVGASGVCVGLPEEQTLFAPAAPVATWVHDRRSQPSVPRAPPCADLPH